MCWPFLPWLPAAGEQRTLSGRPVFTEDEAHFRSFTPPRINWIWQLALVAAPDVPYMPGDQQIPCRKLCFQRPSNNFQWRSSRSSCCPHFVAVLTIGFQCELYIRFPSECQPLGLPLCQFFILKPSLGLHPLAPSNSILWGSSSTNLSNGTPNLLNINNWPLLCLPKCVHIKCACPSG